jgi:transketolase
MFQLGFQPPSLSEQHIAELEQLRLRSTADILTMTTLAGCGHPGGSMSTLQSLLLLYANCRIEASEPLAENRDRIFVSHGHISPGVYAALASFGFCDRDEALVTFRNFGSIFGGHIEMGVPGVEWNTGNLGQGLSAAVGAALGARLQNADPKKDLREQEGAAYKVVCCMGDGEQQKGQLSEARRLAVKYGCNNLIGIVDLNKLQIGGKIADIMPHDIPADWAADGWNVINADGHDWQALYGALRSAYTGNVADPNRPTVVIAETTMARGVPDMEGKAKWHGQALKVDDARAALTHLGEPDRLSELIDRRAALPPGQVNHPFPKNPPPTLQIGPSIVYPHDSKTDCRSAYGAVMTELAENNNADRIRVVAFSADLEGSVKLGGFHSSSPAGFIEGGIQEHNSATASGRLSREGYSVFFSTFGMFGVTEVFNQQRLNCFNKANLKLVCTHCGTDVGEDGPTHQAIDYVGLLRSTFSWEIFVPADPNQCDRIIRTIADRPGNQFVGMGRSKMLGLTRADGSGPFYDGTRGFEPGRADVIRDGDDGAILAVGPMVHEALQAHNLIKERTGKSVRVVNMASLRPFDRDAILSAAATGFVLTAEDHHPDTGLGGLVAMVIADAGVSTRLERAGVDQWAMSGKPPEIRKAYRLDGEGLADRVVSALLEH